MKAHHSPLHTRTFDEKAAFARLDEARRQGDEARVRDIRNDIILANMGLLHDLAEKACRHYAYLGLSTTLPEGLAGERIPTFGRDDFMHEGVLLMVRAIMTFKPSLGNKFSTYASTVVGRGLNQVFKAAALRKYAFRRFVSLDTPVGEDDATLGDFVHDEKAVRPADTSARKDLRRAFAQALATLGERERTAFVMSQGYGCEKRKLVDIARTFGVTPQRVTQIVQEALRKLGAHPALRELRPAS